MMVLIIEDDQDLAHIFTLTLRSLELEIECITEGAAALNRLTEITPDLIILDLHLPQTSGLEILGYIRSQERLAHIPVILATADERLGEVARPQATLLLQKPVSPQQLRLFVNRLLQKKSE
jgi:CheY-like chemotaxis protein